MNDVRVLFPNEPYDRKHVDSAYEEEFNACKSFGIKTYFYDYEELVENDKFISNIDSESNNVTIVYRGWMLKPKSYDLLYYKILEKTNGYYTLLNSPKQYSNCHCFPYIYNDIKEFTPIITVLDNWKDMNLLFATIMKIDYNFFIKDYVKSTKTEKGIVSFTPFIGMVDLEKEIKKFINDRGNLFTNGIVFKEFVELKKIKNKTNEWRAFYANGKLIDLANNVDEDISNNNCPPSELIDKLGEIISEKSNFFTVDFALTNEDKWIVIETGDGGVSGLTPQCNAFAFYNKLIDSLTI
jgi:hypothetical protein